MATENGPLSCYEAMRRIGLEVGPRRGDYLDRRDLVNATTGEVVHAQIRCSDAWALYHAAVDK